MRRSPLHLAVVAALSIPVLLLSACGGGGGASASTTSGPTSVPSVTIQGATPSGPLVIIPGAAPSGTSTTPTGTTPTGTTPSTTPSGTSTTPTGTTPTTTPSGASTIPAGTTQATPTYAAGSVQLAMFNQINAYRQTCGFPAVQQNTLLDQAAANHANYMVQNGGQVTDTEVQGNPGFTGVTYMDRAAHVGMPNSVFVTGGADNWYNTNSLSPTAMGQALAAAWASAVYHQSLIVWPYNVLGFGVGQTQSSGYPLDIASENIAFDPSTTNDVYTSSAPLTFPCQGMTGIPYGINGEIPMPPNTSSGGFGTPVTVVGRMSDQITLTSANMVNTATGQTISLNILNTNTDPNKLIPYFQASAYPSSTLSPNTTYQVNLTGTINDKPFSRSFTFTTSDVLA